MTDRDSRPDEAGGSLFPGMGDEVPKGQLNPDPTSRAEKEDYDLNVGRLKLSLVKIARYAVFLFSGLAAIVILVRMYHLVSPECWGWLTEHQLIDIDRGIMAVIGGAVVKELFKKVLAVEIKAERRFD